MTTISSSIPRDAMTDYFNWIMPYIPFLGIGAAAALIVFGLYWISGVLCGACSRSNKDPKQFFITMLNRSSGMIDVLIGYNQDGSAQTAGQVSVGGIGYHSNIAKRIQVPGCITYINLIDSQSGRTLVGKALDPQQRCMNHDCRYERGVLSIN